jgi:microcystin-dependent protein
MTEPFLSEIRIFSFAFVPKGWAMCNGQMMPINQNQALFALLGTTYGGNGQTNFALPDLRGSVPISNGNGFTLGQKGGEPAHTLTTSELPQHFHQMNASTTDSGGVDNPTGNFPGSGSNLYHTPASLTPMNPGTIAKTGGSQPHTNMQPYLTLMFGIALQGIFPSRN